ncbi:formin-binding protein [Coemansia sp. RSA 2603]|nr:formin-binding protein [Coemansia sp. RSA 2603]
MSYYNNNDNNEVGGFHVPQGSGYAQDDETTDRAYNNAGPYGGNPYGNPTSPPGGFSGPGPNYNNNPYGNNNNQYGNNNNGGYGNNNGGYGAPSGPPSGYQAGPRPQQGGGSNNNNGPYGGNTGGGGYGQQQQHQQQRPVSMHAVGGPPPMQQQPQAQAQHIFAGGSANWNSRPASSMQGSIGANNTFRRASNNDMYAMAAGTPPPPQQQQQQPPQQQFVQRTNSQMGVYGAPPMDPRAPSSVGMYRAADGSVHAQQPPMADASYAMGGYVQPPHLGSPRSRASTFNGAQGSPHQQHISHAHHVSHSHTGQFGTLTAATQMNIPQQPHPNSAPSSPYQHAVNASSRPMSAAGMHASPHAHAHVPPMQYGAVGIVPVAATPQNMYRSATPVQQQQPHQQYANSPAMVNRPPTQMSQMHPMASKTVNGGYQTPQPQQQQPQQHHANSPAAANGAKTADSDKILFYVKVLYDYDAENEKELTIRENDVISVFAVSADGWWDGEMTDRRTGRSVQGTFPSNFTEPISH